MSSSIKKSKLGAMFTILILANSSYAKDTHVSSVESWHFLSKSRGGTISLIKNLTEYECQFLRNRALGLPATVAEKEEERKRDEDNEECKKKNPEEVCGGIISYQGILPPGVIETAECFE